MATPRIAPAHLSADRQHLYRKIRREYQLEGEDHALEVLRLACEALDRCEDARAIVAAEGSVILDRFEVPKAHPAVAIERDSRIAAIRAFRELSLDGAEIDGPRPPRIGTGARS